MTKSRFITATILASVATFALVGCSDIVDELRNESTRTFESTTQLADDWDKSAPWLPSDATTISTKETPGAAPAVLLATSIEALDATQCVETDRRSAPTFSLDGSPDPYTDTVFACGDWAVIATDGGWFGWTPNHPDEKAIAQELLG
jgi:hypothetical protein